MTCSPPGQRHPAPSRLPEAGSLLAGPALPGRASSRRTRPSSPGAQRLLERTGRRTRTGPSSSTRASCSARSTRRSSATRAASRSASCSATTRSATGPAPSIPYDDLETLSQDRRRWRPRRSPRSSPGSIPSFFGLDSFTELERPLDLSRIVRAAGLPQVAGASAQSEDARFVGLTLPRVLMRLPYARRRQPRATGSASARTSSGPDRSKYLWGNAVYAFGARADPVLRQLGLAGRHPRGPPGRRRAGDKVCLDDGGLVTGLPVHSFATDRAGAGDQVLDRGRSSPTRRRRSWASSASSRSATARTPNSRRSTATSRSRSPRSTTIPRRRSTPGSRRCSSTSSASRGSPTTSR